MPSFLTVLLSCLLLVSPGWGDHWKDDLMEMREDMREIRAQMEEERKEMKEMKEKMHIINEDKLEVEEKLEKLRKEMNAERTQDRIEMKMIREEKSELKEKVKELTKKVEIHEKKVAKVEVKSTKDLPFLISCAYQNLWTTPNSTIPYDRLFVDYNNASRPGGGDGNMDITSGVFTSLTPGHYTVTYSGHATLGPGEWVRFYLNRNNKSLGDEGHWLSVSDSDNTGTTRDQGTKSLVSLS